MLLLSTIVQAVVLSGLATGHPNHEPISARELVARKEAASKRHLVARNCADSIASYNLRRKVKRGFNMQMILDPVGFENSTCVLSPEAVEGPYYINNEMIRTNLTEDQLGIPMTLDIAVIDVTTCKPMENVLVEIWAANATGIYSGYSAMIGGMPPGGGGNGHRGPPHKDSHRHYHELEGEDVSHRSEQDQHLSNDDHTVHTHKDHKPGHEHEPGHSGPGGPGGPPAQPLSRNETFLRGGAPTSADGLVELVTIYPGFYAGRTAHIHTMIHMNWERSENGTFVSTSGNLLHVGQFFFEERWNDEVYATSPYTENTNKRTYNDQDGQMNDSEDPNGNSAIVDISFAGEDLTEGLVGLITVGVDPHASYHITNKNYLNSTSSSE
ncbi:Intradiol ring-cleavage dioxygenase [Lentinula edodes]|uniref:Intradiol ring-cleavage dioxygenase n=1 Tax=Lentinula lateritia TaxID=40482 RepID=A0A9W8ZV50_9AGAR|nr:Intradiol ring-cleavage dioxygenase [Lentinula edodes]